MKKKILEQMRNYSLRSIQREKKRMNESRKMKKKRKKKKRDAIQKDLINFEKWSDRSLIKLNRGKCRVQPLGMNNPRHFYMLGATQTKCSLVENDLGVLADSRLNVSK